MWLHILCAQHRYGTGYAVEFCSFQTGYGRRYGIFDYGLTRMKQRDTNMRLTIIRTAVLAFALIGNHPSSADFEAGQSAWDAGNLNEALSQWRDAANADDRRAMLELGRLYHQGLGVVQDYVEAHKWFNLAASRGEAAALEERDTLAAQMTLEQVATAQERAAVWQSGGGIALDEESSDLPAADSGQPPPQAIRAAQSLLAALGYQPGPAGSVWTPTTKAAYQAFLRDAGLPQTEVLTPQALRSLRVAAEQQGVAQTEDETMIAGSAQTPVSSETNVPSPVSPDALHNAAQVGDIEVLKMTITAGVDVNARDSRGWTALMHAANKGYLLLVSELLDAQAEVDIRAPDGATALFIAAVQRQAQVVTLLIDAGADISVQGPQGKTAVDIARLRGDSGIMSVLKIAEARGEMVSIPAGTFRMGDLSGKGDGDARRVHSVTVKPFRLGKYEVTFAQWDACVADGGCDGYVPDDEGWGRGNRPVINVSWNDVQFFISWLNGRTGGNYRLPTEAEWEYAGRAGSTTQYSWGNSIGSNRANCWQPGCGDGYKYTAPVGSFPANAWGLHDMHGNVLEWVQDCWNRSYKGAPSDGSAWLSGNCSRRVIRSGSWYNFASALTSAFRSWGRRTQRTDTYGTGGTGFRLAQDE